MSKLNKTESGTIFISDMMEVDEEFSAMALFLLFVLLFFVFFMRIALKNQENPPVSVSSSSSTPLMQEKERTDRGRMRKLIPDALEEQVQLDDLEDMDLEDFQLLTGEGPPAPDFSPPFTHLQFDDGDVVVEDNLPPSLDLTPSTPDYNSDFTSSTHEYSTHYTPWNSSPEYSPSSSRIYYRLQTYSPESTTSTQSSTPVSQAIIDFEDSTEDTSSFATLPLSPEESSLASLSSSSPSSSSKDSHMIISESVPNIPTIAEPSSEASELEITEPAPRTNSIASHFTFKINFTIMDDIYQLELSSDKVDGEEMMVGRQVITFRTEERDAGVNMIRRELEGGECEFGLAGLGLMEGPGEEELRDFATQWVMRVQRGLMVAIREVELAHVLGDVGIAVDPAQFLGGQQLLEILQHFLDV